MISPLYKSECFTTDPLSKMEHACVYVPLSPYLMAFSPCTVGGSLLSVLSGRPLVAGELHSESLGRASGLGVPGPFMFLPEQEGGETY